MATRADSPALPPSIPGRTERRAWAWFSLALVPVVVAAFSLSMPGCDDAGFDRTCTVAVWQAYPGLALDAVVHAGAQVPPRGPAWLALLIGLPAGLGMAIAPLAMLLAPSAARRRARSAVGWAGGLRLSDLALLSPWAAIVVDPRHVLAGFHVLAWATTAEFAVLWSAALTATGSAQAALPSPPASPTVAAGEPCP